MINAEPIISKMKNQKINYDKVLKKLIGQWEREAIRPKILLHSCCAPCSTYTLEFLTQYADIAIYFANSNIHPKNEYLRRAKVQEQFVEDFNRKTGANVKYIEAPYEPHKFVKMVKDKELADEKEGGLRCTACFEMRLDIVAKAAIAVGTDGLFIETHPEPSKAKSDGANMLQLDLLEEMLTKLVRIREAVRSN